MQILMQTSMMRGYSETKPKLHGRGQSSTFKIVPLIENESAVSENGQQAVKLPKLELPKFSGDIIEWQTFWDKFKATVDSSELPVITKFPYLQSLLEREANASISGLALTSDNYAIACKVLEERFGKKEQIVLLISKHY